MDQVLELILAILPFFKKQSALDKIKEAIEKQEAHNAQEKQALLAAIASGDIDAINTILFD